MLKMDLLSDPWYPLMNLFYVPVQVPSALVDLVTGRTGLRSQRSKRPNPPNSVRWACKVGQSRVRVT